ncbi:hypothetical protein B0O99DRAFT_668493 [Bisporella sp. PMI_857]|nr:hypothetical protein B0O99DRAFT_668806 [Bisporella sp. PMI_857]KAH8600603.1 hypothetical protein B0O99DRAFT_668493 [Bisporella sp. PMI_857]
MTRMALTIALALPMSAFLIIAFYQVFNAGYWGFVLGWFIPCILFFPVALSVAEPSSSMPINGVYYWWTATWSSQSDLDQLQTQRERGMPQRKYEDQENLVEYGLHGSPQTLKTKLC